ncbi:hypothetical protein PoB_002201400 [Plakobranchus ocellatus]|uniref:Uncharacterized protein n=1 Tax=Plakobranchus ocellatus TaxID=259542 RepID=A0AAV3ZMA1_9GAST|nr:hypothetical protein PoB_002201400 [Plakobranchus ocellatus]
MNSCSRNTAAGLPVIDVDRSASSRRCRRKLFKDVVKVGSENLDLNIPNNIGNSYDGKQTPYLQEPKRPIDACNTNSLLCPTRAFEKMLGNDIACYKQNDLEKSVSNKTQIIPIADCGSTTPREKSLHPRTMADVDSPMPGYSLSSLGSKRSRFTRCSFSKRRADSVSLRGGELQPKSKFWTKGRQFKGHGRVLRASPGSKFVGFSVAKGLRLFMEQFFLKVCLGD